MAKFLADNISIQGYSHKLIEKECQDNSFSQKGDKYCYAIVCDGHGGEKYIRSALGSEFACNAGKDAINSFMQGKISAEINLYNFEKVLCQLERSVITKWNDMVERHYKMNPINTDERFENLSDTDKTSLLKNPVKAYGTTFICAVLTTGYCFVLKLGDGNANIIYDDGTIIMPEELDDDQLQFNMTTSLCSSTADMDFKHCFIPKTNIESIVLSSDGVINCYPSIDAYHSLIKNIQSAYKEDNIALAKNELESFLHNLSQKGSGDDLSITILNKKVK